MEREALYKFIGPPLMDSFQKYCGLSEAESELAIKYYRDYFKQYGLYENEVYVDIENMLKSYGHKAHIACRYCDEKNENIFIFNNFTNKCI